MALYTKEQLMAMSDEQFLGAYNEIKKKYEEFMNKKNAGGGAAANAAMKGAEAMMSKAPIDNYKVEGNRATVSYAADSDIEKEARKKGDIEGDWLGKALFYKKSDYAADEYSKLVKQIEQGNNQIKKLEKQIAQVEKYGRPEEAKALRAKVSKLKGDLNTVALNAKKKLEEFKTLRAREVAK